MAKPISEDSATTQIAALSKRGAFIKTIFLPRAKIDDLQVEKRRLSQWLGPVIARASERSGRRYTTQTATVLVDAGVVINAVVTRELTQ